MFFDIEPAAIGQVEALCAIERAAAQLFRGHSAWPFYEAVTMPMEVLREAVTRGLVWVAIAQGEPVGFVWLDTDEGDDAVGVAEIDVLPAFGQRGIGAALLEHACAWAGASGYRRIDLGTLADVPWNAPFYARHGFAVVDKQDPAFAYARERDREHGFPDTLRVFMSRPLSPTQADEWSIWPAPAKLNLFLRIIGRREDGYHDLQTVFRLLDWGDEVRLRVRADGRLQRLGELPGVPAHADLAVRAAVLLQQTAGVSSGADIDVLKRIPIGGGLGGGSSDAASVLVGLNWLWRTGLDEDALAGLGRQLGADVPVFVRGRCAWGQGVGEQLTPIRLPERYYVVVDPHDHVPTAEIFQAPELTRNAPPATLSAFVSGEVVDNVFEPVVRARHPRVDVALGWLGGFGRARLSGSGGCVFLETPSQARAESVAQRCPLQFTVRAVAGVQQSALLGALERHRRSGRNGGKLH